jgi:hypothetical protein
MKPERPVLPQLFAFVMRPESLDRQRPHRSSVSARRRLVNPAPGRAGDQHQTLVAATFALTQTHADPRKPFDKILAGSSSLREAAYAARIHRSGAKISWWLNLQQFAAGHFFALTNRDVDATRRYKRAQPIRSDSLIRGHVNRAGINHFSVIDETECSRYGASRQPPLRGSEQGMAVARLADAGHIAHHVYEWQTRSSSAV